MPGLSVDNRSSFAGGRANISGQQSSMSTSGPGSSSRYRSPEAVVLIRSLSQSLEVFRQKQLQAGVGDRRE